jgi:hypothetical protein
MPVINVVVSEQELKAISEYATQCSESISDLIRKSIIREATLADWYDRLGPAYNIKMRMPHGATASVQRRIIEANYNKIRRIMGLQKIKL